VHLQGQVERVAGELSDGVSSAGGPQRREARDLLRPRPPWWLHPGIFVVLLGIPLLLLAYLIPESSYLTLHRTRKYVDPEFFFVGLIVYLGFLLGSFFAAGTDAEPQERDISLYCRWFVWPLFFVTVFGYLVWFASGVIRAGGIGGLLSALSYSLSVPADPGALDYVKFVLFRTIPGVTTLTQVGVLYAAVEALLWARGGSVRRFALFRFALIVVLAFLRSIVLSERLALLEIILPVLVVLATTAQLKGRSRRFIHVAPLIMGFGAFGLFSFGEYFRSWVFYRSIYNGSYFQFAAERFLGYYTTALNNAAVVYYHEPPHPLRFTLNDLFQFPIVGNYVSWAYEYVGGRAYEDSLNILRIYANPEFNNVSMIGALLNEASVFLAPVVAFLLGVLSASLYRSFIRGRLVGALLYPSWFVGLLEISRIYYWPDERYFPALAFAIFTLAVYVLAKILGGIPPGEGSSPAGRRRYEKGIRT
jgi:hypothetical protein